MSLPMEETVLHQRRAHTDPDESHNSSDEKEHRISVNLSNGKTFDNTEGQNKEEKTSDGVRWGVEDTPPPHICLLLGLQHYLAMFIGSLSVPFVLTPALCMGEDNVGKSEIIGTLFFVSGLITLLQIYFGVRLPLIQAGSFAILSPTLSYLNLPKFECPDLLPPGSNLTDNSSMVTGSPEHRELWQSRLAVVQGSLMVASLLEVVLGFTGAIGVLLRFIGPLSIAPTVSLLGVSLYRSAAANAAHQWWIAFMTFTLIVIFSQYLGRFEIPFPSCSRKEGCRSTKYPLFKMFPVGIARIGSGQGNFSPGSLGAGDKFPQPEPMRATVNHDLESVILAILIAWLLCYIFTITNVFPNDPDKWGYGARTDVRSSALDEAAWFRFPYPGQWGTPMVDIALVLGIFAGLLASMVESVGDYYACARLAGAPPPPVHAINRGIMVEGLGCIIAGAFGTGNGTTSTSINIGVLGITRAGSRIILLVAALFMIVLALLNKFGALFLTVPDPIIGGSYFVLFGMIVAVGISSLQHVDLNSSRNLFIFGFSFFLGLTVAEWVKDNPGAISTGSSIVDNIFTVLLSTSMFVGGFTGFLLDNTIPGTREERGLDAQSKEIIERDVDVKTEATSIYDIPWCMPCVARSRFTKYIPFCPTYGEGKTEQKIQPGDLKIDISTEENCNSIKL